MSEPESIRERAIERFPQVLLTLVSIMQALALEMLWSSMRSGEHLFAGGLPAWIGWLQVVAVFDGILVVWLFYASIVMRLSWTPRTRDSILPFAIGAAEFVLATLLAPELLDLWLYVLAAIFAVSSWTSFDIFTRARAEPRNAAFFAQARMGTVATPIAFTGVIALSGVAVHALGPGGVTAALATSLANAALVAQIALIRGYWNRSMAKDPEPEPADPGSAGVKPSSPSVPE